MLVRLRGFAERRDVVEEIDPITKVERLAVVAGSEHAHLTLELPDGAYVHGSISPADLTRVLDSGVRYFGISGYGATNERYEILFLVEGARVAVALSEKDFQLALSIIQARGLMPESGEWSVT